MRKLLTSILSITIAFSISVGTVACSKKSSTNISTTEIETSTIETSSVEPETTEIETTEEVTTEEITTEEETTIEETTTEEETTEVVTTIAPTQPQTQPITEAQTPAPTKPVETQPVTKPTQAPTQAPTKAPKISLSTNNVTANNTNTITVYLKTANWEGDYSFDVDDFSKVGCEWGDGTWNGDLYTAPLYIYPKLDGNGSIHVYTHDGIFSDYIKYSFVNVNGEVNISVKTELPYVINDVNFTEYTITNIEYKAEYSPVCGYFGVTASATYSLTNYESGNLYGYLRFSLFDSSGTIIRTGLVGLNSVYLNTPAKVDLFYENLDAGNYTLKITYGS